MPTTTQRHKADELIACNRRLETRVAELEKYAADLDIKVAPMIQFYEEHHDDVFGAERVAELEGLSGTAAGQTIEFRIRCEKAESRVVDLEAENAKLKVHPIGVRKQRINDLEKRLTSEIGTLEHVKLCALAHEYHAEQAIDGLQDDLCIALSRVADLEADVTRWERCATAAGTRNEPDHVVVYIFGMKEVVAELKTAIEASEKESVACVKCGFIEIEPPDALIWKCPKCIVPEPVE